MYRMQTWSQTLVLLLVFLGGHLFAVDDLVIDGNSDLTANVSGPVIVRNGASVTAINIEIAGDLRIENGGSFEGRGVLVHGDVAADNPRDLTLQISGGQASRVTGDVQIRGSTGAIHVLDAQIIGHLVIEDSASTEIQIRNNSIGQNIALFANHTTVPISVESNDVLGNLQLFANSPEPSLVDNAIAGPPAEGSLIEVFAAGDEGDETFELQVDQQPVRQWTASLDLRRWRFRAVDTVSADRVRIAYTNDASGPDGFDRNLRIDAISIDGVVFQTEDPTVYSNRSPAAAPGFFKTERLTTDGYFQFGINGVEEALVRMGLNSVLQDGWRFKLSNDGYDITLKLYEPTGKTAFKLRFGSAGALSSIVDSRTSRQLLAKSFQGEVTDRVIQWTLWEQGSTAVYDVSSLPYWEDRFNVTQAGTYKNALQATLGVQMDADIGQLDVWSDANRQWKVQLEPYLQGSIAALTRTNVLDEGALLVRRVIRIGTITKLGAEISLGNPYFESWNPFSDREFNGLALSIDSQGKPDLYYADSKNIPNYPAWPVLNTRGWAMVYHRSRIPRGATVAVVFGRDQGHVHLPNGAVTDPRRFVLNSMDFSGGLAVLPGLWPASVPAGTIIDQYFVFVPGHGIQSSTAAMLDSLSDRLPAPQVYHPGSPLPGELSIIADRLGQAPLEKHTFTNHLGTVK